MLCFPDRNNVVKAKCLLKQMNLFFSPQNMFYDQITDQNMLGV